MVILALKMRFRQKFWHRWKALGLSFFTEKAVVLSYGQPIEGRYK